MGWFELAAGVGSTFTFETYIYDEEPSFRKRRRVSADEMEKRVGESTAVLECGQYVRQF